MGVLTPRGGERTMAVTAVPGVYSRPLTPLQKRRPFVINEAFTLFSFIVCRRGELRGKGPHYRADAGT